MSTAPPPVPRRHRPADWSTGPYQPARTPLGFGTIDAIRDLGAAGADLLTSTYASWRAHRTIRLGAALAYYGLFAIVPLFTVSIALAGMFIDANDIAESLQSALGDLTDGDATEIADAVSEQLDRGSVRSSLGLIGLGSLLLAASLVFVALQDAFDTIWEVPVRSGLRNTLRRRLLAFAVVLLAGAVLVANFAVQAAATVVRRLAPGDTLLVEAVADLVAATGSWALGAAVLASLFRFLTTADLRWRTALIGGLVTTLVLTVGNRLVGAYLRHYGVSSLAGAAGSVLIGLFWIYSIAQIVLAGAELTRTLQLAGLPRRRRASSAGVDGVS